MAALKLPIDEVVHFTVTTRDPATGGESDATGDLVFNIYEEATDAPIASSPITMMKRTSLTGRYRGTFTMSAANGFEAGKFYDVIVTGTVAGVTDNAPVMLIHCVPGESAAGVPKVDPSHLGGDAQSLTDLKDFADAGYDPATNKVEGVKLTDTATTLTDAPADSAGVTTLLSRIPSALFSGITSMAHWLGALAGKQAANATAQTEIRASGAGSGTFDPTTDSMEAVRDRGDAAWITATGFSTLDAAGVRTAVGLASANLDTQLGDLPTVAEFEARTLLAASYFDPAADTVANVTTVGSVTTKTGYALTSAYDLYHADIQFTVDETNTQDEYTISWFKNGARVTSGITVPTLQVVKRADGSDLIASTTPTQIASTGTYKHDATTTARVTAGQAVLAVVTATIDGSTRAFSKLIGRDSA